MRTVPKPGQKQKYQRKATSDHEIAEQKILPSNGVADAKYNRLSPTGQSAHDWIWLVPIPVGLRRTQSFTRKTTIGIIFLTPRTRIPSKSHTSPCVSGASSPRSLSWRSGCAIALGYSEDRTTHRIFSFRNKLSQASVVCKRCGSIAQLADGSP